MASGHHGAILGHVDRIFGGGSVAGLGEGQLLARFVAGRDELAFEALVTRLGPMVLGVCRRLLDDPRDVEDAFQATFLVLVRKAGTIRDRDRLGPWLHGVAHRVAARARSQAARRRRRERAVEGAEAMAPARDGDRHELRSVVEEELGQLPEKYRAPIVLCYLEGLTHEEAAARLRCPVGTVRSRMAWARDRLRVRLDRRGLAPAEGVIGLALVPAVVPRALIESTVAGAIRLATGKAAAGAVSAGGMALAEGVSRTMIANKLTVIGGLVVSAGLVAGGAGVMARQAGGPPATAPVAEPAAADRDAPLAPAEARALRDRADALERRQEALEEEVRSLRRLLGARPAGTSPAPTGPGSGLPTTALPAPTAPIALTPALPPGAALQEEEPAAALRRRTDRQRAAAQSEAIREQSVNNLKQIGLALHNYNDANGQLPPQALRGKGGGAILSWRVALLPFLDQEALYEEFRLNEPWDSDHNIALLARMPAVYDLPRMPGVKPRPGTTFYQAIAAPHTAFDPTRKNGNRMTEITDGLSNTLAVVESLEAVPWTKPADLTFELTPEMTGLRNQFGDQFNGGFHALFLDASVRYFNTPNLNPTVLRALTTRDGGEVVDFTRF